MKKFNAFSVLEFSLIFIFVAITAYYGWQFFANSTLGLFKYSTVKGGAAYNIETVLANAKSKLQDLMSYLNGNSEKKGTEEYNDKRVETTGVIGQLIAAYNKAKADGLENLDKIKETLITELKNLVFSDQGVTAESATTEQTKTAESKANACVSDPSSCTTLMTITSVSASHLLGTTQSNVYNGGKIPITLNYNYSYVDDEGNVKTETVTQTVNIQKEQLASKVGQTYDSFLPEYVSAKLDSSAISGSAEEVQSLMDEYTTGKNCELSKSDGQYYDFTTHKLYECKNAYTHTGSCD